MLGIVGAVIAPAISLVTLNALKSTQILRIHKIHPFTMNYLKPVVTSAAFIFIVYLLVKNFFSTSITIWLLILLFLLFLAIYGLCLLITRSFDKADIMMIQEMEKVAGINATSIKRIMKRFL
jgi:hypothetical protein